MIFERIVCGVDGSPESAEAVRQADLLMAPGGHMLLVGVADVAVAVHAGFQAPAMADMIETETRGALLDAENSVASKEADLVIVGSRGLHGLESLGSVSERVAHEAACSVLVVREGSV